MEGQNLKTFTYTFYHLFEPTLPTESKMKSSFYSNTPIKSSQVKTSYSHLYPPTEPFAGHKSNIYPTSPLKASQANSYSYLHPPNDPLTSQKERKLSSTYASAMDARQSYLRPPRSPEKETPITYQYKNPGCGINITGKSKFEIKGDKITVKIDKVLNSRKGGKSGTLQLQLVKMSYFYDGVSGIRPEEYTSVGTADLGELQGGWSFSDIVRVMEKKADDDHSYRRCYILLLEEYDQTTFKIVDYLNFD